MPDPRVDPEKASQLESCVSGRLGHPVGSMVVSWGDPVEEPAKAWREISPVPTCPRAG